MEVDRDRSRFEPELWLRKWPGDAIRVPSVIKGGVAHRITVREKCGRLFERHRHTGLVQLLHDLSHPAVAKFQAPATVVRTIDVGAPQESILLRLDRVRNHPPHG